MPPLDENLFNGSRDLTLAEAKKLETLCRGEPIDLTLHTFGWGANQLTAGVLVDLSPDNLRVVSSSLFIRGPLLEQSITIQAAKAWPRADKAVNLHLTLPSADKFSYASGGVCSDFLSSDGVSFSFSKADSNGSAARPLIRPEWEGNGVGQFCLRLVGHITKAPRNSADVAVALKATVLLFPETPAALAERSDASQDPSWPGIKVLEAECPLLPNAQKDAPWGCPILPLLITGASFADVPQLPDGEHLRFAIASVLSQAVRPEAHVKASTLQEHWK